MSYDDDFYDDAYEGDNKRYRDGNHGKQACIGRREDHEVMKKQPQKGAIVKLVRVTTYVFSFPKATTSPSSGPWQSPKSPR